MIINWTNDYKSDSLSDQGREVLINGQWSYFCQDLWEKMDFGACVKETKEDGRTIDQDICEFVNWKLFMNSKMTNTWIWILHSYLQGGTFSVSVIFFIDLFWVNREIRVYTVYHPV